MCTRAFSRFGGGFIGVCLRVDLCIDACASASVESRWTYRVPLDEEVPSKSVANPQAPLNRTNLFRSDTAVQ